jgi:hypothetical protein
MRFASIKGRAKKLRLSDVKQLFELMKDQEAEYRLTPVGLDLGQSDLLSSESD